MERQIIERHANRFPGPHLAMVLASLRAGNTEGQAWTVPQRGAPPLLVLWDGGNNVFYLSGDCLDGAVLADVTGLVVEILERQIREQEKTHFKVQPLSPSLELSLPDIFPGITLQPTQTLFMTPDTDRSVSIVPSTVSDVAILPITPTVLAHRELGGSDYVLAEIQSMWPSEDRFYEAGFGVVAVADQDIVCWCTAEYMSPKMCGIGIATHPSFRGKGVATATAVRFLEEARQRDIIPCWECRRDNLPSVRVAEKIGFVTRAEETYWVASIEREGNSRG